MEWLELLLRPSAPSALSAWQYASGMTSGWLSGLATLGIVQDPATDSKTELKFKKPRLWGLGPHFDAGDIDLMMHFNADKSLREILPRDGLYSIRPALAESWQFHGILCESKRTCGLDKMVKCINDFVKFYSNVLNRTTSWTCSEHLPVHLANLLTDDTIPIVFLFNGADCVDVWHEFERVVPSGTIHGHPICALYCQGGSLTEWTKLLEKEVELQEKEVELQEKEVELQEKDAKLREKDAELQEKDAEIRKLKDLLASRDASI
jgi:hypothetical protein